MNDSDKLLLAISDTARQKSLADKYLYKDCDRFIYIDAASGSYVLYHDNGVKTPLPSSVLPDYNSAVAHYVKRYVSAEDRELMLQNLKLETVISRLKTMPSYAVRCGVIDPINGFSYKRISYRYYDEAAGIIAQRVVDITGEYVEQRRVLQSTMRAHSEAERASARAEENARRLERHAEINRAFGSIYFAVYSVDLASGRYLEISTLDIFRENIPSQAENHLLFEMVLKYYVTDGYKKTMQEFLDISTVQERLAGHNSVSCEFLGTTQGWCRASFVAESRAEDGRVLRFVYVTQQINNEKRAERANIEALNLAYAEANRANNAKSEFLSKMSHDIRTPLNAIIGMTAIAGTHINEVERLEDCLKKITISSKHLLSLINEVLDMSKIESGKIDMAEEDFNLSDVVDNVVTMMRPIMEAKHQRFEVHISNIRHEKLVGDSMRIQQVFVNILSNATKYTPDGGRVLFSIREAPVKNQKIACYEFVFEDNGIGMSEEFQAHLFEPFARENDERLVRTSTGTGLGMSIARNIVRMMDGDIEVQSKKDVGSRFTVTMYLRLQDAEEMAPDEFVDLPVLVADDDEIACESACEILNSLGMNSEWVTTGAEALQKAIAAHEAQSDYFAIILDWKMPGMDGLQTAKAIRARIGKEVPIIVFSAYDWSDIEAEAREAGISLFISKPLFKTKLMHLFHGILQGTEPPKAKQAIPANDYTGSRLLLVEDNELNQEIAKEILQQMGITVETVNNGREAVERIKQTPPDYYGLVFMDVQMPIMNGYEAAAAIRKLDRSDAATLPIVAMTANSFAEDVHRSFAAGMNDHISKPLDLKVLTKVLDQWLKKPE